MHPNPRRVVPVVLVLLLLAAGGYWWFYVRPAAAADTVQPASGTIEANTVNLSPEMAGRVLAVNAAEGQMVHAGDVVVQFDTSLLEAQRAQAAANVEALQAARSAAEAAHDAALANFALLDAGPTQEQLAVAQTVVDRAQLALEAAQAAYDALPEAALDTPDGRALAAQVDQAQAGLANAQAQYDLQAAGTRPEQRSAAEAQATAAQWQAAAAGAQVTAAQASLNALDVQIGRLSVTAPVDGVVLARAIQPGEFASPGAPLLVVGQLDELTITVYVPETRYGQLQLGQSATVTVDSYPGATFIARVTHIADQAEFTPRNVQTAEGRKTTVFAIKLSIANPDGRLKPGMPADVVFAEADQ
jgi:HlyD family secretion protein